MFPLVIILFLVTFFFIVSKNEKEKRKWNCREKIDVGQSMGPCRSNNSSLSCFKPKKGTNICSTSLELLKRSVLKWRSVCHSLKMFVQISILTVLHLFTVQLLQPGHLEEDFLIKNVFWKQKILTFFCKQTNKIQGSTLYNGWKL